MPYLKAQPEDLKALYYQRKETGKEAAGPSPCMEREKGRRAKSKPGRDPGKGLGLEFVEHLLCTHLTFVLKLFLY